MSKKNLWITLGSIIVILLFIVSLFVGGYNKLTTYDESIQSSWAQVENQLKRRSDLIPNLVNTVKGYAAHEKELFAHIADARSKLAGARSVAETAQASGELSSALSRLLVVVENYPDLKANQNFNRLMDELSGTENRLTVERMRYNEQVKQLNLYIRRFPGRLYGALYGFEKGSYFEIEDADRAVPNVDFN